MKLIFYKLIVSLLVCLARHAQSTQYQKENVKDEVDFLPADKPQRFLQSETVILGVYGQACAN